MTTLKPSEIKPIQNQPEYQHHLNTLDNDEFNYLQYIKTKHQKQKHWKN